LIDAVSFSLKVNHVSIYYWIKEYGRKAGELASEEKIEAIEINKIHTYMGSKKTTVGYR
jgi:hypothetical protein